MIRLKNKGLVQMFKIAGFSAILIIIPPLIANVVRASGLGIFLSLAAIVLSLILIRIS